MRRLVFESATASAIVAALVLGPAPAAFAAAPTLTTFAPAGGPVGTSVLVKGTGFTGATSVALAGTSVPFTVLSGKQVQFSVPAIGSTGPITVTTPSGTVSSASSFVVEPGAVLSPDGGPPGQTVVVTGSGFRAFEAVDVVLDTDPVALGSASSSGVVSARFSVPNPALPGPHEVTLIGRASGFSAQRLLTVHTDWPMRGANPRHTGVERRDNLLNTGTVAGLEQAWRFGTGGRVSSSPAVVDGNIYVGSGDGKLYAVDAETGQQRWAFVTGGAIASSPAVVRGTVYVGSADAKLYALDAETGTLRWSFPASGPITSSPVVAEGMVYFGSSSTDGRVYAVHADSGEQLWKFATGGPVVGSPALDDGVLYVGSSAKKVVGIDVNLGTQVMFRNFAEPVVSSPAVSNGVVFVTCRDGQVHALSSGEKWSFTASGPIEASPAVSAGTVFVGDLAGMMYAINAVTGAQKWAVDLGFVLNASAAVASGVVYVAVDNHLDALNAASGALLWQADTGHQVVQGEIASSPAVSDGAVYLGATSSLRAYRLG